MSVKVGVRVESRGMDDEWVYLDDIYGPILIRTGPRYYFDEPLIAGSMGRVFLSGRLRLV